MGKNILGIMAGYVSMAVLLFVLFTAAYAVLGADGSFKPGTFETSSSWLVVSVLVSLLAAVVGGLVCRAITKNSTTLYILAGIIVVLGLIFAFPVLTQGNQPILVRDGPVGNTEAMQKAKQPTWIVLVNPILGAAGVLLAGRCKKSKPAPLA